MEATKPRLYIALLVALAATLSFFVWMRQGITLDEAQSVWQTSRTLPGVINVIAKDVHVPLYFVLLHFWELAFGTGAIALRSLSVIFFLASIPAMYALGREAYSRRVASVAALLTAISPFLNWYGSEARMYSLMFLVTALSHLCFIRLWKRPGPAVWTAFALTSILGTFTHPFFVFILFVQCAFFVMKRGIFPEGSTWRFSISVCAAGAAAGAWLVYRHIAGAGLTNPVLARPSSVDLSNVFSNFFIGFQSDWVNALILSFWPLLVLASFTFIARKHPPRPETSYFAAASFVPIALAFVVSATLQPIFLSRYLIICLPSLYALVIYLLSTYRRATSDMLVSALVLGMLAALSAQAIEPSSPVKEGFREAAAYVEQGIMPTDLFVVSAPFLTYPVEYYYRGAARLDTFPKWERYAKDSVPAPFSMNDLATTSAAWARTYNRLFLLLGYDQGYNEDIRIYMDEHYQRLDTQTFSRGLALYVYKLRYP
ncbi:MAG TPA: glycosyltransferase family 39 protein [Candidatus Paceibacterota bacterium]|nr:glycosyltransferase family 39 protein [Candidatus Paceibacterota bacterium]